MKNSQFQSLSDKFMDYVLCCNFNTMIAANNQQRENEVTDRQDLVHDEIMTHFIIYNDICVHYYIIKRASSYKRVIRWFVWDRCCAVCCMLLWSSQPSIKEHFYYNESCCRPTVPCDRWLTHFNSNDTVFILQTKSHHQSSTDDIIFVLWMKMSNKKQVLPLVGWSHQV